MRLLHGYVGTVSGSGRINIKVIFLGGMAVIS